mmetsp:Transcript_2932/g.8265  ORF Transcript_2932/g.8265 Transcript_2932/m.8265 type:complete len:131 (+) Transcript_2932:139-531(+)
MVLATDMSHHFSILTAVRTKVIDQMSSVKKDSSRVSVFGFAEYSKEQQHLLLQLCLKAADIGHCCLPAKLHIVWTERLQREFWRQGDLEKERGYPLSPLADRAKPGALWGSNQVCHAIFPHPPDSGKIHK